LDAVDLLTENQSLIAPTPPRSVYFDVVVEAGRPGFDADSFRQGLQEALVQDPDLLALGRRQGGFNDHAGFVSALVSNRLWRPLLRRPGGCASTSSLTAGSTATSSTPSSPTTSKRS
jgi:hypothetical protein